MKKIIYLKRIEETKTSTIGDLTIEGLHQCWILEDGFNFPKIPKITRVPAGEYKIILNTTGEHHFRYLEKYPDFHIGMLQLENVPGFNGILIHILNTVLETDGCLGTGDKYFLNKKTNNYQITGGTSEPAYIKTYKAITALMNENDVYINIS